eukprot:3117860-Pleurochrysis_carterae.AAC.2
MCARTSVRAPRDVCPWYSNRVLVRLVLRTQATKRDLQQACDGTVERPLRVTGLALTLCVSQPQKKQGIADSKGTARACTCVAKPTGRPTSTASMRP